MLQEHMMRQAELVQARTKQFAIDILKQFSQVPKTLEIQAIEPPLIKAVTGLAARCHSIGRLPSDADLSIALSAAAGEADEARFWLELLDATGVWEAQVMGRLMQDASDIAALLTLDGETSSSERAQNLPTQNQGSQNRSRRLPASPACASSRLKVEWPPR